MNLSSMGGFVPVPGQAAYCAAKAAVKMLTEGLALELADTGVSVSVVCPGAVATSIRQNSGVAAPSTSSASKARRILSAREAAEIIVSGVEKKSPYIFVGRDATMMSILYRLSPTFASNLIAKKMRALLPS